MPAGGYSFKVTFDLLKRVDLVIGLRVNTEKQATGLDLSQLGERGWSPTAPLQSEVHDATRTICEVFLSRL